MFLLRKISHKPRNSQPILTVAARLFTSPVNSIPDEPTSAHYDLLVNAAGESRDFDNLHHLLTKRVKDHCFNTVNTFKFITNSEASLSLLPKLSQTLARLPKGFTRKCAYDALISRLCKLGRVEEALRVVELMAREDYGLNACSFHAILNLLTKKQRNMAEARRVVELMRKSGAPPDLTSYNYLLMGYCFSGDLAQAAGILSAMEEEGLRVDARTYDALVLAACNAGKLDGAMVLLRRMADDGVPVLLSTHVYVVNSLLSRGFYEQAVKFVRGFSGKDTWLDTEAFGRLAVKLIKLERFGEAKEVLDEMRKRGLVIVDQLKDYESKITNKKY
ncbi:PREDICTED: pentatricopeptide repeat-containing protein At3g56030 [Fragaria vesca subsp. vesca]|uniref:pentatricopeptide repeat-containing protein At3g56030 n=1 Tax=Fragaria vesca subsp. vesca TaxID=101020 RepID=UPI0002C3646A|nr:PREDICTED: pentatricopeptide repeat-containing protein At3g56030 [Fragaria vesca subsp. vesca]